MLPKNERIKYRGLFTQAYKSGKVLSSKNLKITFTQSRSEYKEKLPFIGISIPKSFNKKAVIRNKIRRRLVDIYRKYRVNKLDELKKIGLLVISSKGTTEGLSEELEYLNLEAELSNLLDKMLTK